tara:strand:+ start:915 stop:1901 length:987 start_codon:yes stop_codon:yes gene_type:complete
MDVTALTFSEFGAPLDVLKVERMVLPEPQPNQVVVRMQAAPINPADINLIEGTYGVRPDLPCVAGTEGVGTVSKAGVAVSGLRRGDQVVMTRRMGSWCEAYLCEAGEVYPIPPGLPVEQAAMLAVNPPTAWCLLGDFVNLRAGDWIIQNAANSAVGRCVIQLASHRGIRTVNIVRRPEVVDELREIGADVVIVHEGDLREQVRAQTGGAPLSIGLNATGGIILKDMVKCLADAGTLVTYGAMARQPFTLSNAHLIFRDIRVRGFWVRHHYRTANAVQLNEMFTELCSLVKRGALKIPVEKTYPLFEGRQALEAAMRDQRAGKVVFTMG